MDIQIKQSDDIILVSINGDIDGRSAPHVQEKLLPLTDPGCKILLDMSGVAYMSSAGLRTLLLLYRQIDDNQGCVVLTGLSEMIQDMMSVTGFLDFFVAYDTVHEGLAALAKCNT